MAKTTEKQNEVDKEQKKEKTVTTAKKVNQDKKVNTSIKKQSSESKKSVSKENKKDVSKKTTSKEKKVSVEKKDKINKPSEEKKGSKEKENNKNKDNKKKDKTDKVEKKGKKEIEDKTKEIQEQEDIIKIEEIKKVIKNKKTMPKEEKKKIRKLVLKNIMVALLIVTYFSFLILGKINIKNDIYVVDLKVFGMCTLLTAIILFEFAYKKDSGQIALYGIETLLISIITIALVYINLILSTKYIYIVLGILGVFALYYIIKTIIVYIRKRKQYFVDDMKEMMNKDE